MDGGEKPKRLLEASQRYEFNKSYYAEVSPSVEKKATPYFGLSSRLYG
jgi:hypothetical protein